MRWRLAVRTVEISKGPKKDKELKIEAVVM